MTVKLCGARTRAGTPCKRVARQPQGRCKLHGGASLYGPAHPNWKHGRRSKHCAWMATDLEGMRRRTSEAGAPGGRWPSYSVDV